jgi:hypothetical protein
LLAIEKKYFIKDDDYYCQIKSNKTFRFISSSSSSFINRTNFYLFIFVFKNTKYADIVVVVVEVEVLKRASVASSSL